MLPADRLLALEGRFEVLECVLLRQQRITCRLSRCVKALWLALTLTLGLLLALLGGVMTYGVLLQV
jgi:hypothetical protein